MIALWTIFYLAKPVSAQETVRDNSLFFQPIPQKKSQRGNFLKEISESVNGTIWSNTSQGVTVFDGFNFKLIPINPNGDGNEKAILEGNSKGQFACFNSDRIICIISPTGEISTYDVRTQLPKRLIENKAPHAIYDLCWTADCTLHLMVVCFEEVFLYDIEGWCIYEEKAMLRQLSFWCIPYSKWKFSKIPQSKL